MGQMSQLFLNINFPSFKFTLCFLSVITLVLINAMLHMRSGKKNTDTSTCNVLKKTSVLRQTHGGCNIFLKCKLQNAELEVGSANEVISVNFIKYQLTEKILKLGQPQHLFLLLPSFHCTENQQAAGFPLRWLEQKVRTMATIPPPQT